MILFRFLKLFGVDVPAHMAQLQVRFEQRVEAAKDQVPQAAQTAAIVAALCALAMLAALSAVGAGLFALYSWVLVNYGQFYGLAAVGGVLIVSRHLLFAGAFLEAKSWDVSCCRAVHFTGIRDRHSDHGDGRQLSDYESRRRRHGEGVEKINVMLLLGQRAPLPTLEIVDGLRDAVYEPEVIWAKTSPRTR